MTYYRKKLLNKVTEEQGLEAILTIGMFQLSDHFPEPGYDHVLAEVYNTFAKVQMQMFANNDCEGELDEIPEDNMNQDADSIEEILAMVYEESGWDE